MNIRVSALLSLLSTAPASGRRLKFEPFSSKTLSGTYAIVVDTYTYKLESGAYQASGLGLIDLDGYGNLSGDIKLNRYDDVLTEEALSGTYSLGSNGRGDMAIVGDDSPDTVSPVYIADTVVTKVLGPSAVSVYGNFLAVHEEGALVNYTMTRRDSDFAEDFSDGSGI